MIMLRELNNRLERLLGSAAIHPNYLGVDLSVDDATTRRKAYKYCTNMRFTTLHPIFGKQAFIMYGSNDAYNPVIMPVTNTNIFFEINENDKSITSIYSNDIVDEYTFSLSGNTWTFSTSCKTMEKSPYNASLTASNVQNTGCLK
jgi:hypothetical protein